MTVSSNICVVGGSGMLGSYLIPYLRGIGHRVFCFSRKYHDGDYNVLVNTDSDRSLGDALDICQPSIILNLAALTDVDLCERDPHQAYLCNVGVVERLSRWVTKNSSCHLIQVSTDHNYDEEGPQSELDITIKNYYGFSKYAGELAAISVGATVLRTNFFGKSLCAGRQSFSDWSYNALAKRDKISVFEDIFFSPLSMLSLSKCIERVIHNPISGVFNLGSRKGLSKADFVFKLAHVFDFDTDNVTKVLYRDQNFSTPRPSDMRMDSTRFELAYYPGGLPTLEKEINLIVGEYSNEGR